MNSFNYNQNRQVGTVNAYTEKRKYGKTLISLHCSFVMHVKSFDLSKDIQMLALTLFTACSGIYVFISVDSNLKARLATYFCIRFWQQNRITVISWSMQVKVWLFPSTHMQKMRRLVDYS